MAIETAVKHYPAERHPVRLLVLLIGVIALAESVIMVVLRQIGEPISVMVEAVVDAFFLVAILFPVLYSMVLLPLLRQITERKAAEERLRNSLREKDLLLREVNHRVKNNLQIISGLLALEEQQQSGILPEGVFQSSRNRIEALALIYENLSREPDLHRIDMAGYLRNLAGYLVTACRVDEGAIHCRVDAASVPLDIVQAIPCGLIANELLENAFRHAFPSGQRGEVTIALQSPERGVVQLTVADTGAEFRRGDLGDEDPGLGKRLVGLLVEQLGGDMTVAHDEGYRVDITFRKM